MCRVRPSKHKLTRSHAIVFACLLAVFVLLTFLITNAGVDDGPRHNARVWQTTVGTITGPLTGAISRGFQSCCLRFSLTVMAWCAPVLLLGVLVQFLSSSDRKAARAFRMTCWALGWLVWFMVGILSFAHALE